MNRLSRFPVHLVLMLMALAWVLPTLGLLISSLRPPQAVATSGWWNVFLNPTEFTQLTLANYREVMGHTGMARAFWNSLAIALPSTLLPMLLGAFAAFAFAWLDFPGRDTLFLIVVGLISVPLQISLIPILRLYSQTGLAGTFTAVWFAHTAYGLPFSVYLLRNFFITLPKELFEAAYIDGASTVAAFFRLAIPMSGAALAALGIFQFLWVWNDLLVALIYLGGSARVAPLTLALSNLVGSYGQQWHVLTAAAFVTMVVPLVVFFALQKHFVRGILAGSLKG
ncbi:MAG: carbohydrate ABC transporter permease [Betaproteobacteria bacterium]